ncbi:MAG: hypothetical protein MO846_03240 [Candidatus Devosia symbiotica]|nr:hypothetical protein [Candidatus Devosia symbiotica]
MAGYHLALEPGFDHHIGQAAQNIGGWIGGFIGMQIHLAGHLDQPPHDARVSRVHGGRVAQNAAGCLDARCDRPQRNGIENGVGRHQTDALQFDAILPAVAHGLEHVPGDGVLRRRHIQMRADRQRPAAQCHHLDRWRGVQGRR